MLQVLVPHGLGHGTPHLRELYLLENLRLRTFRELTRSAAGTRLYLAVDDLTDVIYGQLLANKTSGLSFWIETYIPYSLL